MKETALKVGGFALLGTVVFAGAFLFTFPSGLVARIVEAQAEKATGFAYDIDIGAANLRGLGGATLYDVRVASTQPLEEGERRPRPLQIDRVRVSVPLLSIPRTLGGTSAPSAKLTVKVDEGQLRVASRPGEDTWGAVLVEFFDVELASFPMLKERLGLGVRGTLAGTVALRIDDEHQLAGGEIDLGISRALLEAGSVAQGKFDALPDGIPLPNTPLGTIRLEARLTETQVQIGRLEADGGALRLNTSGQLTVRSPWQQTGIAMPLEFQLDSDYVEEAGLGPVLGMFPQLQRAQVGDGYAMTLGGALRNIRISPGVRRAP